MLKVWVEKVDITYGRQHFSDIYYLFYFSLDGECAGVLEHGECHPTTGICVCQAQRPVQIGGTCVNGKFAYLHRYCNFRNDTESSCNDTVI